MPHAITLPPLSVLQMRLEHFAGSWCCRSPDAMERYGFKDAENYRIRPSQASTSADLAALSTDAFHLEAAPPLVSGRVQQRDVSMPATV